MQFKLPEAGDFSPFSPLHAFLDISDFLSQKFDIFYLLSVSGKGPSRVEMCTADIKQWKMINKLKMDRDKTEVLVLNAHHQPTPTINSVYAGTDHITASASARNIGV